MINSLVNYFVTLCASLWLMQFLPCFHGEEVTGKDIASDAGHSFLALIKYQFCESIIIRYLEYSVLKVSFGTAYYHYRVVITGL